MSSKYSTIQQHEPLRAPAGWSAQEKRFVAQLEEILDDLYSRFGRLRMEDLGGGLRSSIVKTVSDMAEKADKSDIFRKFIQLEEPVGMRVGDTWVQTDPRMWQEAAALTWKQTNAGTWDAVAGYPMPKAYVWDGSKWVIESDARTITWVAEAESEIVQLADKIETKVSETEYELDRKTMEKRVSNAESSIVQQAKSWTAEFNKVGLAGKQTGITKIDEAGVEVTHSNIGGKTSVNADGFRLYDASGNVIGGLISLNGSVVSAVQRLANIKDTTFFVEIAPNIYGDGENGLEFIIDSVKCGAITAQYLDNGVIGMRIRSENGISFSTPNRTISLGQIYANGENVHYSATDPGGNDGDIWLKPVDIFD